MSGFETAILAAYYLTLTLLALYGCHRTWLLYLYHRWRAADPMPAPAPPDPLPRVTVQLPIYNERCVVERLLYAACGLDYPAERLEIQVLDDSTDDTTERAARCIAALRARGHDIVHLRRRHRDGYKAGALAAGLRRARGEFIAIFDADFVPGPRFLRDLLGHFHDPRVGMVQARWGFLNRERSLLTRLQAILLDGHFLIEHAVRHRAGLFFNFNGTAGIWRRACIVSAGGWQSDTLTEDLDLSYRSQMKGWRFVFAPEVMVPGELPDSLESFHSQQHRWARGSIETGRKILPRLLRSPLPAAVKIEALFHLTNNAAYALLALLAVLIIPAMSIRRGPGLDVTLLVDLVLFMASTGSIAAFYLTSQRRDGVRVGWMLLRLPALLSLGAGLCLNNSRAVLGALWGGRAEFVRTPKRGSVTGSFGPPPPGYRSAAISWLRGLELLTGAAFGVAILAALADGRYAFIPFLLLFQAGFLGASIPWALELLKRLRNDLTHAADSRR